MPTVMHIPLNEIPRIEEMWMVLSVDANGNEGVVAASTLFTQADEAATILMPLVTANEQLLPTIKTMARNLQKRTGQQMRLVKFTTREDLGDIRHGH